MHCGNAFVSYSDLCGKKNILSLYHYSYHLGNRISSTLHVGPSAINFYLWKETENFYRFFFHVIDRRTDQSGPTLYFSSLAPSSIWRARNYSMDISRFCFINLDRSLSYTTLGRPLRKTRRAPRNETSRVR